MKHKILLILLLAIAPLCSMAQKAYETSTYSGKIKGHTITFKLANGYIGASEVDLFTPPKKPAVVYRPEAAAPDNNNQLSFRNDKAAAGYFIIKNMQDAYDQVPGIINGVFIQNDKSTPVKLLLDRNKI